MTWSWSTFPSRPPASHRRHNEQFECDRTWGAPPGAVQGNNRSPQNRASCKGDHSLGASLHTAVCTCTPCAAGLSGGRRAGRHVHSPVGPSKAACSHPLGNLRGWHSRLTPSVSTQDEAGSREGVQCQGGQPGAHRRAACSREQTWRTAEKSSPGRTGHASLWTAPHRRDCLCRETQSILGCCCGPKTAG